MSHCAVTEDADLGVVELAPSLGVNEDTGSLAVTASGCVLDAVSAEALTVNGEPVTIDGKIVTVTLA